MSKGDDTHFDEYRFQTAVKHQILDDYLPAYFNILKSTHSSMLYFDGFAGRGYYEDEASGQRFDGSPLRALRLISASPDLAAKIQTIFVEKDETYFASLKPMIEAFVAGSSTLKRTPIVLNASFRDAAQQLSNHADQKLKGNLPPTFMFVDPCGVAGVSMPVIADLLRREWCELFLFFNSAGARRILGLDDVGGSKPSPTMLELFGSATTVTELRAELEALKSVSDRELAILRRLEKTLRVEAKTPYVLPFRIECEGSRDTSHYLVHATKHPLGFKVMKHVMRQAGRLPGDALGRFELLQASANDLGAAMRSDAVQLVEEIRSNLKTPEAVGSFIDRLVARPEDRFSARCYKTALLELETKSAIRVFKSDGVTPAPAAARKPFKGQPTLGDSHVIKFE